MSKLRRTHRSHMPEDWRWHCSPLQPLSQSLQLSQSLRHSPLQPLSQSRLQHSSQSLAPALEPKPAPALEPKLALEPKPAPAVENACPRTRGPDRNGGKRHARRIAIIRDGVPGIRRIGIRSRIRVRIRIRIGRIVRPRVGGRRTVGPRIVVSRRSRRRGAGRRVRPGNDQGGANQRRVVGVGIVRSRIIRRIIRPRIVGAIVRHRRIRGIGVDSPPDPDRSHHSTRDRTRTTDPGSRQDQGSNTVRPRRHGRHSRKDTASVPRIQVHSVGFEFASSFWVSQGQEKLSRDLPHPSYILSPNYRILSLKRQNNPQIGIYEPVFGGDVIESIGADRASGGA